MLEWSLGNLAAWAAQAAAVVAAGAWLPVRLRLGAPRVRLAACRLLLLACVGLPLAQPWRAQPAAAVVDGGGPLPALDLTAPSSAHATATLPSTAFWDQWMTRAWSWASDLPWTRIALVVLAAGVLVRLAWLALGLVSLARLRRSSSPLEPGIVALDDARCSVPAPAEFRVSSRVPRPVTFGLRRPVVLVPPGFAGLEPAQQRAIACHELLHVHRQDWLRALGDEIVRALLWFHPAIWWLVEQIHLTTEQAVDRDVVSLTGDRRSYLKALLALAEVAPGRRPQPAACFLDHGHLSQRVAMLLEEASMSRGRVVASVGVVLVVLGAGGWWSVGAFPLHAAPLPTVSASPIRVVPSAPPSVHPAAPASEPLVEAQAPPPPGQQAKVPGVATAPSGAMPDEATLKRNIQLNPKDLPNYFMLGMLYEKAGDIAKAGAAYEAAVRAVPTDKLAWVQAAGFYSRAGNIDKATDALTRRAALDPSDPIGHYILATYYWDREYRDTSLSEGQKRHYIDLGLQAADRAVALNADYSEALTYKHLLLRSQALLETDEALRQQLTNEADKLRERAIAIRKSREMANLPAETYPSPKVAPGTFSASAPPPPPPPPPPPGKSGTVGLEGAARIGGEIKPPSKIRDVKPIYPPEASAAKVQGVVIVDVLLTAEGKVAQVKVLRSIPMLDDAAVEAVRQWEFTPTYVNGTAVPVIMTATVNFTLQ